jgi:hypothetical protein
MVLGCMAMTGARGGHTALLKTCAVADNYVHNVYPFLSVNWGGNTFVGSVVPFGMVKLGPDMETSDSRPSSFGRGSRGRIHGFSHLHLSGASGKCGNILSSLAIWTANTSIAIFNPRSISCFKLDVNTYLHGEVESPHLMKAAFAARAKHDLTPRRGLCYRS